MMAVDRQNNALLRQEKVLAISLLALLSMAPAWAKAHPAKSKHTSNHVAHSPAADPRVVRGLTHINRSVMQPHVKQKVWISNSPNGGLGTSVTTGMHNIKGWEKSVIKRDPNLPHWEWLGMQEADKAYMHIAPGADPRKLGLQPHRSHYVKPVHVATVAPHHQPVPIATPSSSPHYVKPIHAPLPKPTFDTAARIFVPKTNVSLSAPTTKIRLAAPNTHVTLAAPGTNARLATRNTNARLTTQNTNARLASQNTSAQLTEQKVNANRLPPDEMSAVTQQPADADTFQDPSKEFYSPYGPSRHPAAGASKTHSSGSVRGRLLKRGRGY